MKKGSNKKTMAITFIIALLVMGLITGFMNKDMAGDYKVYQIEGCSDEYNREFSVLTKYLQDAVILHKTDQLNPKKNKNFLKHINKITEIRNTSVMDMDLLKTTSGIICRSFESSTYSIQNSDEEKLSPELEQKILDFYKELYKRHGLRTELYTYIEAIE